MQKAIFCCLLLAGMFASSVASAVSVQFTGSLTGYTLFAGANDPLSLLANPGFSGRLFTGQNGTANSTVLNGTITIGANNFVLGAGTFVSNAANTQFNGMAFTPAAFATTASLIALPGNLVDTQASLEALVGSGGTFSLVVNGGGNLGIYQGFASVTAVPEPTSMALIATSMIGLAGYGWRRRRKAAAKV